MNNKVSYIIVTWNNQDIICDCIDSLLKYSNVDLEIIVVDNNSSDETCNVIKTSYKCVNLIELTDNLGFSKANNIGLELATGRYTFFVNPDVIFIENIIVDMIRVLENNDQIGIVTPRLLYNDLTFQKSVSNFPSAKQVFWNELHFSVFLSNKLKKKYAQAYVNTKDCRYVDWAYGAALLCRTEEVKEIGGFPVEYFMYGEDTEFCMKFKKILHKKTFYVYDQCLIHLGGYSEAKVINSKKVVYGTNAAMSFVRKYQGKNALTRYKVMLMISSVLKYFAFLFLCFFSGKTKFKNKKIKMQATINAILNYREDLVS